MRAYALITHDRLVVLNPSEAWILGSATFTIVASRTTISWQIRMTVRTRPARASRAEPAGVEVGEVCIDMRGTPGVQFEANRKVPPEQYRR